MYGHKRTVPLFWWIYIELVSLLLTFIYPSEGWSWGFASSHNPMIQYFITYDHQNYSRWGPVYLNKFCIEAFVVHIQPGRS